MKSFKSFLKEEYLIEEVSSNTKGVMHELLVGYHLKGGKHMDKHPDKNDESPKQVHDRLKSTMSKDEYNSINNRAKAAAGHIHGEIKKHGHSVHDVHWTSKPGDLHRSTGIHATQQEDASDVVVHAKDKKGNIKYHGVSLKVSDENKKHLPVSNPGIESTLGGKAILDKHRENINKAHPKLKTMSKADRKEYVKNLPEHKQQQLKDMHGKALNDVAENLHKKLSSMSQDDLKHHLFKHVLQANPTPMQQQGHFHHRHVTYMTKNGQEHHNVDPSNHYESLHKKHKYISVERRGTSIIFKYPGGKTIAKHRIKFESQSDPHSSIKGSGEPLD